MGGPSRSKRERQLKKKQKKKEEYERMKAVKEQIKKAKEEGKDEVYQEPAHLERLENESLDAFIQRAQRTERYHEEQEEKKVAEKRAKNYEKKLAKLKRKK